MSWKSVDDFSLCNPPATLEFTRDLHSPKRFQKNMT